MKKKLVMIAVLCISANLGFSFLHAAGTGNASQGRAKPLYGLNFSPYLESQSPDQGAKISEEQIKMRLQIIRPYTQWIRTFSCANGLENIGKLANVMGLKTLIGAWIGKDYKLNNQETDAIIKVAKRGDADIVAVGNEVLLRGDLKEDQLISYINKVKTAVKKYNPNVKVSTVDGYYALLKHPKVMEACDVILINCYPFWEGCRLEDSIMSLNNMYEKVKKAGKGKEVIISETGWPSEGKSIGKALPTKSNAQKYLKSVLEWVKTKKVKCFYFTSFDESWKTVHEGDLGAYWGIFDNSGAFKYKLDSFKGLSVKAMPKGSFLPIDGIFIPSGYMGSIENVKLERVAANSGDIRNYMKICLLNKNQSGEWSGIYWQYPANNWGSKHGLNLFHPQRLTFYAKGDKGGECTEFKVGGISGNFADSINPAVGTSLVKLSNRWEKYSINLSTKDASSVIGGFCCVASTNYNPYQCAIYLANIQFEW